jgi:hypothetical protein
MSICAGARLFELIISIAALAWDRGREAVYSSPSAVGLATAQLSAGPASSVTWLEGSPLLRRLPG